MDLFWSEQLQLCSCKVCQDGQDVRDFQRLEEGETPRGRIYEECLVGRKGSDRCRLARTHRLGDELIAVLCLLVCNASLLGWAVIMQSVKVS